MVTQVALSGGFMGVAAFAFFAFALAAGWGEAETRNTLLLLMVLFENVHVFNARSETRSALRVPFSANPFVVLGVIGALGVHVAAMYLPFTRTVLAVTPLGSDRWLGVIAIALGLLGVMEIYKALRRRA